MIESQWSILKAEFYDRYEWNTTTEAIHGVEEWIYDSSPPQAGGTPILGG